MGEKEEIRAALEAGRHEEAWALYQVHAATADAITPEAHYLGGRAAERCGNIYGARRTLEWALDGGAAGQVRGKVLLVLGEVCRRIGDLPDAERYLTTFLEEMPGACPELAPLWRGIALHNLGLTYRQRGRLQQARESYEAAAAEFRQEGLREHLGQTLWSLAWVLCLLGDPAGARVALAESESARRDDLAQWHQQLGWAFCETLDGWQDSTTRTLTRIMKAATAPPDVVAHAHWLMGREALRQGNLDAALAMADQAIAVAESDRGDTRAQRDAIDLRTSVLRAMKAREQAGA